MKRDFIVLELFCSLNERFFFLHLISCVECWSLSFTSYTCCGLPLNLDPILIRANNSCQEWSRNKLVCPVSLFRFLLCRIKFGSGGCFCFLSKFFLSWFDLIWLGHNCVLLFIKKVMGWFVFVHISWMCLPSKIKITQNHPVMSLWLLTLDSSTSNLALYTQW